MASAALGGNVIAADFPLIPLLIVAYVIWTVIASLAKTARQAGQRATTLAGPASSPPAPAMTADQVRAALARRRAALLAAQQQSTPPSPVRQATPPAVSAALPPLPDVAPLPDMLAPAAMDVLPNPVDAMTSSTGGLRIAIARLALPAAALAVIASAVIGPCAAHRGGGHQPEDW